MGCTCSSVRTLISALTKKISLFSVHSNCELMYKNGSMKELFVETVARGGNCLF
jgi:hypothetical protein